MRTLNNLTKQIAQLITAENINIQSQHAVTLQLNKVVEVINTAKTKEQALEFIGHYILQYTTQLSELAGHPEVDWTDQATLNNYNRAKDTLRKRNITALEGASYRLKKSTDKEGATQLQVIETAPRKNKGKGKGKATAKKIEAEKLPTFTDLIQSAAVLLDSTLEHAPLKELQENLALVQTLHEVMQAELTNRLEMQALVNEG